MATWDVCVFCGQESSSTYRTTGTPIETLVFEEEQEGAGSDAVMQPFISLHALVCLLLVQAPAPTCARKEAVVLFLKTVIGNFQDGA